MANQSASSVSTFLHYNFSQIISYLFLSIHLVMQKTDIDPNYRCKFKSKQIESH